MALGNSFRVLKPLSSSGSPRASCQFAEAHAMQRDEGRCLSLPPVLVRAGISQSPSSTIRHRLGGMSAAATASCILVFIQCMDREWFGNAEGAEAWAWEAAQKCLSAGVGVVRVRTESWQDVKRHHPGLFLSLFVMMKTNSTSYARSASSTCFVHSWRMCITC